MKGWPDCSYSFVTVIAARSASATGPTHLAEVYIYENPPRRLAFVLLLSFDCTISTRSIPCQCNSRKFYLTNLPKHHRVLLMLPRRRKLAVQRRSRCWRKNLARANRPSLAYMYYSSSKSQNSRTMIRSPPLRVQTHIQARLLPRNLG